ncbi:60S acidic ribosomal protein P1 [Armadillidium nasatum]|uniref:Large ribosomal subunit protein P1 n=1 Tax=Armadillidium nasatum TaxID=96803 RepID=A0A5N5SWQ9_9CRUS|nr:60S acidic ribosomal protein P1 [Armadillidium nasatum]
MTSKDELACVYAALILLDDDVPITAEKISTILKAANVNVEPYWPGLFAKAAAGLDLRALVSNVGSGVGSGAPAPAAAAGGGGGGAAAPAAKEAPKKEEKKEEPEEESDDDMGFGLFD